MQFGSFVRNMCFFRHLKKCKGKKKGGREGRKEGCRAERKERGREEERHLPESWIALTSHPVSLWGPEEFALRMTRSGLQIPTLDVKWNEQNAGRLLICWLCLGHWFVCCCCFFSWINPASLLLALWGLLTRADPLSVAYGTSWGCSPEHEISLSKVLRLLHTSNNPLIWGLFPGVH